MRELSHLVPTLISFEWKACIPTPPKRGWVFGGLFLRWWPPSTVRGPLIFFISVTTRDVWIIPSFWIWGYVLHVEHISCVITNCDQHQRVIPSLFSIALWDLLEENITKYPYLWSCLPKFCFYNLLSLRYSVQNDYYYFSLLSSGWSVIAVCGSISVQGNI